MCKLERGANSKSILYILDSLLCVQCRTSNCSISIENFVPCLFASKHSSSAYAGMIYVDIEGLYLCNQIQSKQGPILLSWSSILRWEHHKDLKKRSVFDVHVMGFVLPDEEDVLESSDPTHSFSINGFIRDVSLDICCLAIIVKDHIHNDLLESRFKKFAWCSRKNRGKFGIIIHVSNY